jgi:hypothetical protein
MENGGVKNYQLNLVIFYKYSPTQLSGGGGGSTSL